MSLSAAFWRFAHKRYQTRTPSLAFEFICLVWATFWAIVLAAAALAESGHTVGYLLFAIPWVGVPFALAIAHRTIRLEKGKGDEALYRKRLRAENEQSH